MSHHAASLLHPGCLGSGPFPAGAMIRPDQRPAPDPAAGPRKAPTREAHDSLPPSSCSCSPHRVLERGRDGRLRRGPARRRLGRLRATPPLRRALRPDRARAGRHHARRGALRRAGRGRHPRPPRRRSCPGSTPTAASASSWRPCGPGRRFVYRLTFERRLPATAVPAFRSAVEGVLRRGLALDGDEGPGAARGSATVSAVATAYEQALNQGQVVTSPRGEVRIEARGPLLDSGSTEEARAREHRAPGRRRVARAGRTARGARAVRRDGAEPPPGARARSPPRRASSAWSRGWSRSRRATPATRAARCTCRPRAEGSCPRAPPSSPRSPRDARRTGRRWGCATPRRRKRPTPSATATDRPRRTCSTCASGSRGW